MALCKARPMTAALRRGFGLAEGLIAFLVIALVGIIAAVVADEIKWSAYKELHSCYEVSRQFDGITPITTYVSYNGGESTMPVTTYINNYTAEYQCDNGKVRRHE